MPLVTFLQLKTGSPLLFKAKHLFILLHQYPLFNSWLPFFIEIHSVPCVTIFTSNSVNLPGGSDIQGSETPHMASYPVLPTWHSYIFTALLLSLFHKKMTIRMCSIIILYYCPTFFSVPFQDGILHSTYLFRCGLEICVWTL